MTTRQRIETEFRRKVVAEIRLVSEGAGRYRVFTPFQFNDGDCFSIVLKQEGNKWLLSDEAHTYMHMSYAVDLEDLQKDRCGELIGRALMMFGVEDRDGELVIDVSEGDYGERLFSFVQALLKISAVADMARATRRGGAP